MVQPLQNRVLIELIKQTEVTLASGLIVQEMQAPQAIRAKVLAIGPDVTLVKAGDTIFAGQYAPTEVKEQPTDKTYIIPEEDILAVVSPDKPATK